MCFARRSQGGTNSRTDLSANRFGIPWFRAGRRMKDKSDVYSVIKDGNYLTYEKY